MKIPFLNILKANEEITTLTAKNDELTQYNEQLKTENETLKQNAATFSLGAQDWAAEKENLVKGHEQALAEMQTTYAKQITDLETKAKDAKETAGKQAADIVASLGVEPEAVKPIKDNLVMSGKGYKVIDHRQ